MNRKYVGVVEIAKLVRKALKETFPGVKFSVRSEKYAGGASIDIFYTDGPTRDQVDSVTSPFRGAYFDGMTDYQGSRYAELDGEPIHSGAHYIFSNRVFTDQAVQTAIDQVFAEYEANFVKRGIAKPTVEDYRHNRCFNMELFPECAYPRNRLDFYIGDVLYNLSFCEPQESETAKRITFMGDDGYRVTMVTGLMQLAK